MMLLVVSLSSWRYIAAAVFSAEAAIFMSLLSKSLPPSIPVEVVYGTTATALTVAAFCFAVPMFQLTAFLLPCGGCGLTAIVVGDGALSVVTLFAMTASGRFHHDAWEILHPMAWDHVADVTLRGGLVTILCMRCAWNREMRQQEVMRAIEETTKYKVCLLWHSVDLVKTAHFLLLLERMSWDCVAVFVLRAECP
jgi:hypothetical protein